MAITLYYQMFSPPVRAVILTMQTLGIPYELKKLHLFEGEHLSEEFLKINPQHTIPTIQDDDGFVVWESAAINAYLVNKYAPNDELYPKEPKARAIVDQRLHFNTGVLFPSMRKVSIEAFIKQSTKKMTDALIAPIEEAYGFIEKFLEGKQYIAGNTVTIADFSIITSLGNSAVIVPLDKSKYPLIAEYLKRCELNIPGFKELNDEGVRDIQALFKKSGFEIPSQ